MRRFITVTWTIPGSPPALGYRIRYRETGTLPWITAATGITSSPYEIHELSQFLNYDVEISTQCSATVFSPIVLNVTTEYIEYAGSGRSNVDAPDACDDATTNNRTFYSRCNPASLNPGCVIFSDTDGTLLTTFTFVKLNGIVYTINPTTAKITGVSVTQCT